MSKNSFGTLFRITTWGESHGKAIGVVIDGCPAGLTLAEEDVQQELDRRSPGKSPYASPRKEPDEAKILSGIFEGITTGAPISIMIENRDADSSKYEKTKELLRPGHANFTYLEKYGVFDYRGGGRASARETACRVAAGAVAKKLLQRYGISLVAYVKKVGAVTTPAFNVGTRDLQTAVANNPIFCPDAETAGEMMTLIKTAKAQGDSLGGQVEFIAESLPIGLGEPVYQKLEAKLADAMMSLPAAKGFETGSGFTSSAMCGSEHNDPFISDNGHVKTASNHSGGTLGGISTGMPVIGRVAFKPTSSIRKTQPTVTVDGKSTEFKLPQGSRHDPCVAIRAVPIVEAMAAVVIADALLLNRSARL